MGNIVESNWNIWKRQDPRKSWMFVCAVSTHSQASELCKTLQCSGCEAKADLVSRRKMLTMIKVGDRIVNPQKVRSVVLQNEPDPEVSQSAPYVSVFFDSDDIMHFYDNEATAVWHYFQGAATNICKQQQQDEY